MKLSTVLKCVLALTPFSLLFLSGNSSNVPPAKTGANGEPTCAECHTSTPNTRGGAVKIEMPTLPYYTPGVPQIVTVRVTSPASGVVMGFQLTVRKDLNPEQQAGTLAVSSGVAISSLNGIQYASHSAALTPVFNQGVFQVLWTPPTTNAGNVRIYVAAVAGKPDLIADGNDEVYTAALAVSPASEDVPTGFRWQNFDGPGSPLTPMGIANDGTIVGYYGFPSVGFVRAPDGTFTSFVVSGSETTRANGVNVKGEVVGTYSSPGGGSHGFVRTKSGVITSYDFPGASYTLLNGINDASLMAGGFGGADFKIHGFLRDASGQTTVVDSKLGESVTLFGVNNSGAYVGRVTQMAFGYASALSGRLGYESLVPQGCFGPTRTVNQMGVNDVGEIAGSCGWTTFHIPSWESSYFGPSGVGTVLSSGNAVVVNGPQVLISGINNSRQMVAQDGSRGLLLTPCTVTASGDLPAAPFPSDGGTATLQMSGASDCRWFVQPVASWIKTSSGSGNGPMTVTIAGNDSAIARTGVLLAGGRRFSISQNPAPCTIFLSSAANSFPAAGGLGSILVGTPLGCPWIASSNADWLKITSGSGTETGTVSFQVLANTSASARNGVITVGNQQFPVTQAGVPSCTYALDRTSATLLSAATLNVQVTATPSTCQWTAVSNVSWITATNPGTQTGSGLANLTVAENTVNASRSSTVTIAGITFTVTQASAPATPGLYFVPITACRVMDTRSGMGFSGAYGPPRIAERGTRDVPVTGVCGVPANAQAFSLNVTVVPPGYLGFLTVYPTGGQRPLASTLNSWNGRVAANATIVPAGSNGTVSVYASNETDVVMDINGYFVPTDGLVYYPIAPCRMADTRPEGGKTGQFGPPFVQGNSARVYTPRNSDCLIPSTAQAFYLNVTVVPKRTLGFLTVYPAGEKPFVSTLNSSDGQVVSNGAIVAAATNGNIFVYASDDTDVIIDIAGYFGPSGPPLPGIGRFRYYTTTPCRVLDTRNTNSPFGPGTFTVDMVASGCGVNATASAVVLNATIVPSGYLGYLTLYPPDTTVPLASNLNSWNGQVVANLSIVRTGSIGNVSGLVTAYASNETHLVLDVTGYFAP